MEKRNTKEKTMCRNVLRGLSGVLLALSLAVSGALILPQAGMQVQAYDPWAREDPDYHIEYYEGSHPYTEGISARKALDGVSGDVKIRESYQNYYVRRIDAYAFAYKGALVTSIEIPASITSIGDGAFADCTGLKKLVFLGATPPGFGSGWLSGCSGVTIEIPAGASETDIAAWAAALASSGCTNYNLPAAGITGGGTSTSGTGEPASGAESASASGISAETEESGAAQTEQKQKKHKDSEQTGRERASANQIPAHTCQYEWVTVREAGAGVDGEQRLMCKLCGSVESVLTIPAASAQTTKLYDSIALAGESETVTYDMEGLHTISDKLLTTLHNRSDVTLVLTFTYQGKRYETTFPAGADYTELLEDESTFYGLLGVNGRCGIVTEEV